MTEWQPIDSAPKDGTRIWVFAVGAGGEDRATYQGVSQWRDEGSVFYMPEYEKPRWEWMPQVNLSSRLIDGKLVPNEPIYTAPTHWQPLPSPPVAIDEPIA